jgi:hypothetical protein
MQEERMTQEDFAEPLRQLVDEAEDTGPRLAEMIEALTGQVAAMRERDL